MQTVLFAACLLLTIWLLYNTCRIIYISQKQKCKKTLTNSVVDAGSVVEQEKIAAEDLILKIQNTRFYYPEPKHSEAYASLKSELVESAGRLRFEKFFKWEMRDGCYTLTYLPVYECLRLHYYNFYTCIDTRLVKSNEEISLDADCYFGKISSVKSPAEGVLKYLVPPMTSIDFKSGIDVLVVDTNIEEYERKKAEEAKMREEEELLNEKRRITKKIKEKHRKEQLERIVRQELIDSGELYGEQPKRPPIPRELVDAVYRRDGGRCVYCGSTENLQIDHIIPFSKGGATTIENLQLLCQKCNLEKSNKIG